MGTPLGDKRPITTYFAGFCSYQEQQTKEKKMKLLLIFVALAYIASVVNASDMDMDAEYLDYPVVDKRARKSLVDQMISLVSNMRNGRISVQKRHRKGIISYLYDLARKDKRGGSSNFSLYQFLSDMEQEEAARRNLQELGNQPAEDKRGMKGAPWNNGKK